jgi:glycosyltransferase involved in cell wall biosynthesis
MSSEKPKICHLTTVHPPFDTRIFHKEAKSLAKAGYLVTLIAKHDKEETIDGVKILPLKTPRNRILRMTKTLLECYRKAVKVDADLYHLHDPELLLATIPLRLFKKKCLFDMHENVPKSILTKQWVHPAIRKIIFSLYKLMERILLFKLPVVLAEQSYLEDYEWAKKKIVVQNYPLSDELLKIKEKKYDEFSIGYIGGVGLERGSIATLESLGVLKKRGLSIRWECIGPVQEKHRTKLIENIKKNNLSNVYLRGYMPPSEGWKIIARCHVGLAILSPIPNYVKSFPTKMFEYMALGIPVIVSNFPLYRSVVEKENCGLCINPEDPYELANAIEWMFKNREEAIKMGERGREAVRNIYRWENEMEKLLEFYNEILGQ